MHQDDSVLIPLYARDSSVRAYTLVDAADADFINQWRWGILTKAGYAIRGQSINKRGVVIYLHRELLGLVRGDGLQADHINRDKLDNRRANLRAVTHQVNQQNTPSHGGSSAYRGVYWSKTRGIWIAQYSITEHGRRRCFNLGGFDNEIEAAEAARTARGRLMPGAVD